MQALTDAEPTNTVVAARVARTRLTGHVARREVECGRTIWDSDLPGFGLRGTGKGASWIVALRERGRKRWVTLGPADTLGADAARAEARRLLAHATLDGLVERKAQKVIPPFRLYAEEFWADYAHHWKPSTQKRNRRAIDFDLVPVFGAMRLDAIEKRDVLRWRDALAQREGIFNRTLPVLASMLAYAEQLGYRRKGSNPCRGTPRYKRQLPERFLSMAEYKRLARALDRWAGDPDFVAIIRLLLLTGARLGEITSLKWEYVKPPRLALPDSKTGPKIIYLNPPAQAVLDALSGEKESGPVFPATGTRWPRVIDASWYKLRRHAALPDVRLHDLRHSYASVAVANGVSLLTIGRLLGHALPETTARYAHLADSTIAEAAARIDRRLSRAMRGCAA